MKKIPSFILNGFNARDFVHQFLLMGILLVFIGIMTIINPKRRSRWMSFNDVPLNKLYARIFGVIEVISGILLMIWAFF